MKYHKEVETDPRRTFKKGDKVLLVTTNLRTKQPTKKLDDKKAGPFTISEKISSCAYHLELPITMHIHDVFHINLRTPSKEDTDFHCHEVKPPPMITAEGEEEYQVDRIVAWEDRKNRLYYQVRWEGYGPEEDTMERAKKIAELNKMMESFLTEHPNAPTSKKYKHTKKTTTREAGKVGDIVNSSSTIPTTTTPSTTTTTTTTPCQPWSPATPTLSAMERPTRQSSAPHPPSNPGPSTNPPLSLD